MSPTIKDFEELARSVDGHGPADRVPLVRRRARRRAQAKAAGSALALVLVAGGVGTALDLGGTFRAAPPARTATTAPTVTASPDPTATTLPPVTPPATSLPTFTAPAAVEPFSDVRWRNRTYPMQCPGGRTDVVLTDGVGQCGGADVELSSRDVSIDGRPFRLVVLTADAPDEGWDVVHLFAPTDDGGAELVRTVLDHEDRATGAELSDGVLTYAVHSEANEPLSTDTVRLSGPDLEVTRVSSVPRTTLDVVPAVDGRTVSLEITGRGSQWPWAETGTGDRLTGAGRVTTFRLDHGDGSFEGDGHGGEVTCLTQEKPVAMDAWTETHTWTYDEPGTYTVTVRVGVCAPGLPPEPWADALGQGQHVLERTVEVTVR